MNAPKRRWLHYGEPWGLLAKANPTATRASVARNGIAGAIIGVACYAALAYFDGWSTDHWLGKSLFFAACLGCIAALYEWQVDESSGDEPPSTDC